MGGMVGTLESVMPITTIPIQGAIHDTAATTVHRGHAVTRPRAHHTTKLHPLRVRFREVLPHQSGASGPGGYPAVRVVSAAREETVSGEHQCVRLRGPVSVPGDAGDAVGQGVFPSRAAAAQTPPPPPP